MKKYDASTKIVSAIGPVDVNAAAVTLGDWVSLENYDSLTAIVQAIADADAGNATVRLRQAKTATGGDAKDLDGVTFYTAGDAAAVGENFASSENEATLTGTHQGLTRGEVTADQLDVAGGFKFVAVQVTRGSANGGKIIAGVYVLRGARYSRAVPQQPAVLT